MAATDPAARSQAARNAATTRVQRMAPEQRRDMTAAARHTLHQNDLAAVDEEARQLGQYPLDPATRAFRANLLAAVRARRASDAARAARAARRNTAHQDSGTADIETPAC